MTDRSPRPRIVMLVDNGVLGDSRVLKESQSASEAGFDVVLLGKFDPRKSTTRRWMHGEVEVRLIPIDKAMNGRRYEWRTSPLRSPLAYSSARLAKYRELLNTAIKEDLRYQIDEARVRGGRLGPAKVAFLRARLMLRKVQWQWISFRRSSLETLTERKKTATGLTDRFWTKVHLRRSRPWRHLDPQIMAWEVAFGKVIDGLKPDLIHANDYRMMAIGSRAKTRAAARGRDVKLLWDAHEFLPGQMPSSRNPRWHLGQVSLEKTFAHIPDRVITVTEPLADLLVEAHHMPQRPEIILNAPIVTSAANPELGDIRTNLGVADDVPLMIYVGGLAVQRGVETLIRALPALPDVVLGLVVPNFESDYARGLLKLADELGVRDRVLGHPFVPADQIIHFLATATVGVTPHHHLLNHEIALPTKFFEYSHAGLPIITSDITAMAEMIRSTGQGEVFVSQDVDDFVRAARTVLDNIDRYRAFYAQSPLLDEWTWEAQDKKLVAIYESMLKLPPREGNR